MVLRNCTLSTKCLMFQLYLNWRSESLGVTISKSSRVSLVVALLNESSSESLRFRVEDLGDFLDFLVFTGAGACFFVLHGAVTASSSEDTAVAMVVVLVVTTPRKVAAAAALLAPGVRLAAA